MKRFVTRVFLWTLIYLIGFIISSSIIYTVEYGKHRYLKNYVQTFTEEYGKKEINYEDYAYSHNIIYLLQDGSISNLLSGEMKWTKKSDSLPDYSSYIQRHAEGCIMVHFTYFIGYDHINKAFLILAHAPLEQDSQTMGEIYIVHSLKYLGTIYWTLFFLYSAFFILVFLYVHTVRKTKQKIETIYRQYIANVSHELKSPVASILAITENLGEDLSQDKATRARYYGIILREASRLKRSIMDIIELSKAQERRIDFRMSLIASPVESIFLPVAEKYGEICEELNINFCLDDSVCKLPALYTNADRIVQILGILLDNSVKFTDSEGNITISAFVSAKDVTICVADDGCGIEPEVGQHVFERFYRSTDKRNQSGSGLGLSIAKELVKQMGGEIWMESSLGEYTKFLFTIRRKKIFSINLHKRVK